MLNTKTHTLSPSQCPFKDMLAAQLTGMLFSTFRDHLSCRELRATPYPMTAWLGGKQDQPFQPSPDQIVWPCWHLRLYLGWLRLLWTCTVTWHFPVTNPCFHLLHAMTTRAPLMNSCTPGSVSECASWRTQADTWSHRYTLFLSGPLPLRLWGGKGSIWCGRN